MRLWIRISSLLVFAYLTPGEGIAQKELITQVLVVGGGTGGIAAGLQAARSGSPTLLVESTNMLGGMLTAAGVSCTDGNDGLAGGIWGAFRQALYDHYKTKNLATGWVSETCFEPHVGDSIFKAWAAAEKNLRVLYGWHFLKLSRKGNRIDQVYFENAQGKILRISSGITIDATELGDLFAAAGAPYDLGTEDPAYSGEKMAPGKTDIIQDITWTAVLKDYGAGIDKTIPRPPNYRAENYYCCCTSAPCTGSPYKTDAKGMLDYGKLPGNKYMINWPAHGNDFYLNVVQADPHTRAEKYALARQRTLGFIYFIQTRLGFKNLAPADDELAHGLALIPYNREGRRVKGVVRLNVNHILEPYDQIQKLYRTGIAVGDYPVDHHHGQNPATPLIRFPPIPSFTIPLGALVPEQMDDLIVCEKGISVSNIVNGATRLQPVVLLCGQAAGMLAAWSIQNHKQPREVDVRAIQEELLREKAWLMPFADVPKEDADWESIQRVGLTGILRGRGKPQGWSNKTYFYPDSLIGHDAFLKDFNAFDPSLMAIGSDSLLTIEDACSILDIYTGIPGKKKKIQIEEAGAFAKKIWNELGLADFDLRRPVRRRELARLLDKYGHVFEKYTVNLGGEFIRKQNPEGR